MSTKRKNLYTMIELEARANKQINQYGFVHDCKNDEQEETYRTKLRRQRDKILYTGGFRRLQDKTQVMSATLKGDHRTRLTHTLEVEQIALSIADALGLNRDLVSAIALGHDVGHTPFGHAAERTLDKLLTNNEDTSKDRGGFHHPIQSIKYLWEKYGDNIDDVIYEGILSHDSDMFSIDKETAKKQLKYVHYKDSVIGNKFNSYFNEFPSTLEAQVVIWADKIAYITHDLEDFINSYVYVDLKKNEIKDSSINENQYTEKKLCAILTSLTRTRKKLKKIEDFSSRNLIRAITSNLINRSNKNINKISDLMQNTVQEKTQKKCREISPQIIKELCPTVNLENRNENYNLIEVVSQLDIDENKKLKCLKKCYLNSLIINFEDEFRKNYYELRSLLDDKYIFSSQVQRSDAKAQHIVKFLYEQFTRNYKLTPLEVRAKIDDAFKNYPEEPQEAIIDRLVASYISTMSDTYAENMFCNLSGSKDDYNI